MPANALGAELEQFAADCGTLLAVMAAPQIVLFTDFGLEGPYVGQVKAVLAAKAPGSVVIDLFADAPAYDAQAAAYLLAAYSRGFADGTVFLCVVDPGVGDRARPPIVVRADRHWFVGPDNGLFNIVGARARSLDLWEITWTPEHMSASFHGRDLFAPVAAHIAAGGDPPGDMRDPAPRLGADWPDDLEKVIYIDHFGNAITGVRAAKLGAGDDLVVDDHTLARARTFSEVPENAAMWYENANGLAEIAVNCGRADTELNLVVGSEVAVRPRPVKS